MPGRRKTTNGEERPIPQNTIAAWRAYRDMGIEDLAAASGLSVATISNAANRKSDVTGRTLLALSKALQTTPGALLDRLPTDRDDEWWEIWNGLSGQQRASTIDFLKTNRDNR